MKIIKFITLFTFVTIMFSCEEVVEIDLDTAAPRLVIDATVNLNQDDIVTAIVKLTTTRGYYVDEVPGVTDAEVRIIDEDGTVFPFEHDNNGNYIGYMEPQPNTEYTLEVFFESELYTASTQLVPTVPFESIEQENDGGFSGDEVEVKVFFTDPPNEENFYFLEGIANPGRSYDTINDEFFDGNLISYSYSNEDLQEGDEINFKLYGINEQNYNYLFTLIQQTGNTNGPFGTQPATVRGNIVNQTNPENFAFGYFRISEVYSATYVVQ